MRPFFRSSLLNRTEVRAIFVLALFALLFSAVVGMWPGYRVFEWDLFWHDILRIGRLHKLRESLLHGEWNALDPYVGLDYNILGETTLRESPLSPFSLLTLLMDARSIVFFRWIFLFIFFLSTSYLYLRRWHVSRAAAFAGTILLAMLPIHVGKALYSNLLDMIYCVPAFLWITDRSLIRKGRCRLLLFAISAFFVTTLGDVYVFFIFPSLIALNPAVFRKLTNAKEGRKNLAKSLIIHYTVFFAASAHYLIPLAANIREIGRVSSEFDIFREPKSLVQYWAFMRREVLLSILSPVDGSQAFLYVPFSLLLIAISGVFPGREARSRLCRPFFFTTLTVFFCNCLIVVVFYSIPALARSGSGTLRYHFNILPILTILCAVLVVTSRSASAHGRRWLIILASCGLIWDWYWFRLVDHSDKTLFRLMPGRYFELGKRWFADNPWHLYPGINFAAVALLLTTATLAGRAPKFVNSLVLMTALIGAGIKSQSSAWSHLWSAHFRSPLRWDHYVDRQRCLENTFQVTDPNYRILPAGAPQMGLSDTTARNWKLLAEPEAAWGQAGKYILNHRENTHAFEAVVYSAISGFPEPRASHFQPPIIDKALLRKDLLRLLGVKYIISADRPLTDSDLKPIGKCVTRWPEPYPLSPQNEYLKDSGELYIYELKSPLGMAFLIANHDDWKATEWKTALLAQKTAASPPWANANAHGHATITNFSPSHVDIKVESEKEQLLVISRLFRNGWIARIGEARKPLFPAFGGLIGLKVPKGNYSVRLEYYAWDFYAGLFISFGTLIVLICRLTKTITQKREPSGTHFYSESTREPFV